MVCVSVHRTDPSSTHEDRVELREQRRSGCFTDCWAEEILLSGSALARYGANVGAAVVKPRMVWALPIRCNVGVTFIEIIKLTNFTSKRRLALPTGRMSSLFQSIYRQMPLQPARISLLRKGCLTIEVGKTLGLSLAITSSEDEISYHRSDYSFFLK